jgi:mannosyltransferase OCH1-like enzyme
MSKFFSDLVNYKDSDPRWSILEDLYYRNFIFASNAHRAEPGFPKKIHQIWLGGEVPEKYKKWMSSWSEMNPSWEYKLWTDENTWEVIIPKREEFNSIEHLGQKSDYLRYHILNQFGGLYVDTDFECLRPFDSLLYLDFLTGIGYSAFIELYIGLIASVPNHPVLLKIIDSMQPTSSKGWKVIFNSTGTYFFTKMFFEVITKYTKGVVALPTSYLYPFPNNMRFTSNDAKSFAKDYSYAVHHWEVSWNNKNRKYVSK